jgi:hypothetical protein
MKDKIIRTGEYKTFLLPNASAVTPILSVATLVFGGIFLAPLRKKFRTISKAENKDN